MATHVILNAHAGGGSAGEAALEEVLERLPDAELYETDHAGHARELAAAAAGAGVETVVAAGGDGTLNEVLNGLAPDFRPTLGLLPLGTGNDFARTAEIPEDPRAAVEALVSGRVRTIDLARVVGGESGSGEDHYFVNVSAGGFSGEMSGRANEDVKRGWGPLSYVRLAFQTLPELEAYDVTVRVVGGPDDGEILCARVINAVVANGRYAAHGLPAAPHADIADGLLDLMLILPAPIARLSLLLPKLLLGQHQNDDLIIARRARGFEICAEPAMAFNVDGELLGECPLTFEVVPRTLRLLVPADAG